MTRAEKKEELIGLFSTGAIYLGDLIDECFEFADAHPNWISVEDELPKNRELVFITDCESADMGFYDYIYDAWQPFEKWLGNITHWMPKPAPPEHIAGVSKKIGSSEKPNNCQQGEEIRGNQGGISPNSIIGCKKKGGVK